MTYQGEERVLSKNEFSILYYLIKNQGRIVSRDELMDHLWDCNDFIDDNTLTVNINRLRKKLEEAGIQELYRHGEDRGTYYYEKNRLYKRLLETDPSLASYRGTDTDSTVLFPGKERADDPCGRNPDPGTCRDAFVGVYAKKPVLQGVGRKTGKSGGKYLIREMLKAPDFLEEGSFMIRWIRWERR